MTTFGHTISLLYFRQGFVASFRNSFDESNVVSEVHEASVGDAVTFGAMAEEAKNLSAKKLHILGYYGKN
jgi:hypothetical protein